MSDKKSNNINTLEEAIKLFAIDKKNAPDILFISGIIGNIEQKKEGLVELSIATRQGKDSDTNWVKVTATNPMEGNSGRKLADFFSTYASKGMKVALGCKAVVKDEKYLNIYIREFMPVFQDKPQ